MEAGSLPGRVQLLSKLVISSPTSLKNCVSESYCTICDDSTR